MRCDRVYRSKHSHEHSYVTYLTIGLIALVRDREIGQFDVQTSTVSNLPKKSHWLEGIKLPVPPMAKRSYRLKVLRRKPVAMLAEPARSELQVCAGSTPASHTASYEDSISETSRSQGQDSQSHEISLWDSSVAEISVQPTSTADPSTGASSSLVTPNSVRSSAVTSSASSVLPAYSEREPVSRSQRHSLEVQMQSVSLPEDVYFRDEPDTHSKNCMA
jgi:hypothetical protein